MGFSINTLTLFGIILATGIVVDDAIVVIENIERHIQEDGKPARQAASDAMREVFGAVIATALVLIAVFVPVAFFPGTTGRLYSQFSITIAFSVALSAFNALTLTPALSGLLLDRAHHGKGVFFSRRRAGHHAPARTRYVAVLGRAMRLRWAVVLVFFAGAGGDGVALSDRAAARSCRKRTPATSSPSSRRRPAHRWNTRRTIARQAEQMMLKDPDIEGVFSVMGFSFSGAAPNQGLIFSSLKPFVERKGADHELKAVLARLGGPLFGISGAIVVAVRAAVDSRASGSSAASSSRSSISPGRDINALAAATFGDGRRGQRLAAADRAVQLLHRERPADDRRDRSRAGAGAGRAAQRDHQRAADLHRLAVRQRLRLQQPRLPRLRAGGPASSAPTPAALGKLYVRNRDGQMLPLENVVRTKETTAPQVINHFNLFRSATINGSAKPGFSSGQALEEMERVAQQTLPAGMSYAWSGLSFEEARPASRRS